MEKSGSISFFLKYWYLNFCTCSHNYIKMHVHCTGACNMHICKIYVQCKL